MSIADRVLLFFYLIGTTCLFALFILLPFGYIPYETAKGVFDSMFDTKYYMLGALVLLALNIRLIFGLFAKDKASRIGIVKITSDGEINITHDTIKSLVLKTAGGIRGVRDIKVIIKPGKENLNIILKVLILPDVNIPQTVNELQVNVKSYIEAMAEIPIGEIKVIVQDLASTTRLRVE